MEDNKQIWMKVTRAKRWFGNCKTSTKLLKKMKSQTKTIFRIKKCSYFLELVFKKNVMPERVVWWNPMQIWRFSTLTRPLNARRKKTNKQCLRNAKLKVSSSLSTKVLKIKQHWLQLTKIWLTRTDTMWIRLDWIDLEMLLSKSISNRALSLVRPRIKLSKIFWTWVTLMVKWILIRSS